MKGTWRKNTATYKNFRSISNRTICCSTPVSSSYVIYGTNVEVKMLG